MLPPLDGVAVEKLDPLGVARLLAVVDQRHSVAHDGQHDGRI